MTKRIKIVSIGGGWVVNHRHVNALRKSGLYEVIGAVSNHEDRARTTAQHHGLPNHGTELDFSKDWLADAEAVMIGTIPHVHHTIAEAALRAGKHVLTEKPMTVDPADARALIALAEENQRVLAVVHNFQFGRAAKHFLRDVDAGMIGEIKAVYGIQLCNHRRNIPAWCDELPLGLFYDEAPHFYYMFRWLSGGEIELVSASVWKQNPERNTPQTVSAEYRAPGGFPVFLHINFDASITEWHVTVVGDKATVDIDVWRDIYVRLPNDGAHRAKDILWTSLTGAGQHFGGVLTGGLRYLTKRHHYGNDEVVRRFYRAIQGEDCLDGMSAQEGLRVVELMHQLINKANRIG